MTSQKTTSSTVSSSSSSYVDDELAKDYNDLVAIDDLVDANGDAINPPLKGGGAAASAAAAAGVTVVEDDHAGQHPALREVSVVDCQTCERIIPNGPAVDLDNDCFSGKVMLMMRTPDVDENPRGGGGGEGAALGQVPQRISSYFKGKKRRFEFQFKIKLKKVPTGPLFLGCELEHPIRVGTITKGLVGILLAMVRRINPGFHYSWGCMGPSESDKKKGKVEKTHLSFPVEASMDRIVITKPGATPPTLGEELYESNESVKRRRKLGAGCVDWNLDDTYTMCLWSAYADWIQWKSMNVPGVSPFSFCRVTGTQPIYLSVYEISGYSNAEYRKKRPPHLLKDLQVYTRLEFANDEFTTGGLAEKYYGIGVNGTNAATTADLQRVGDCATGPGSSPPPRMRNKIGMRRMHNGRRNPSSKVLSSEHSLPDTESVDSDFETASRVTML